MQKLANTAILLCCGFSVIQFKLETKHISGEPGKTQQKTKEGEEPPHSHPPLCIWWNTEPSVSHNLSLFHSRSLQGNIKSQFHEILIAASIQTRRYIKLCFNFVLFYLAPNAKINSYCILMFFQFNQLWAAMRMMAIRWTETLNTAPARRPNAWERLSNTISWGPWSHILP